MRDSDVLPQEYEPYHELIVCSNRLINGKIPVKVNGLPVLLIGQGEQPRIWLRAPDAQSASGFAEVVSDGKANQSQIDVFTVPNTTVVLYNHTLLLLFVEQQSKDVAEVSVLNLTPIGINIYGDRNGLNVGTNKLVGNRFENVGTMISIEDAKPPS